MVNKAFSLLHSAKLNGIHVSLSNGDLQLKVAKGIRIDSQLLQEIKDNKELIIDFLSNHNWKIAKVDTSDDKIPRFDRDSSTKIPLSFSQERLWFIDQLEGSVQYHMPVILRLRGLLDTSALSKALQGVVNRHEVLRTVIAEEEGSGYQQILSENSWELDITDGSTYASDSDKLQAYIISLTQAPFDLSKDHMLRATLIELNPLEQVLVATMHHIASDGWSASILVKEVVELYKAFTENREAALPPLEIQYADYSIWQRNYLQGEVWDKKLGYWKTQLQNAAVLQLPTDYSRPAVQSTRGGSIGFTVDKNLSADLQALSQAQGTTLFMTLLSAFKVLLHRYSGQEDISVGSPAANRTHHEVEPLIGFFVNTLTLRSQVEGDMSFKELLQEVKNTTLEAYSHQDVPFEKVVEAVMKERDMSRSPLFQVMFVFQNTPEIPKLQFGEVELSSEGFAQQTSKYDLSLFITQSAAGLQCSLEYNTDLYKEETIEQLETHFTRLLHSIVASPDQKIGELTMLSPSEEHQLTEVFNATSTAYPRDKSLIDLFEEQVKRTPDAIALVFQDQELSYQELNNRSNQLGHYLISKGISKETLVPIVVERSPEMVIGILGILKSGAAYVPVDPDYPEDRIGYMLEDSGAVMVITSISSKSRIGSNAAGVELIALDGKDQEGISSQPTNNPGLAISPEQLAYVIYTSGSTGKPKGVMIEHTSLINLLESIGDTVGFKPDSVFLSVTTYSFDICYLELYTPLIKGGKLILLPKGIAADGFRLAESLALYRPTHMQATPSTWQLLIDANWENRESIKMLIGGEAIKEDIKNVLTLKGDVFNVYGPTETTIWSSIKKLAHDERVVIGKPIANTSIYILDTNHKIVPTGVLGEIYIAGAGLARGYLNQSELTREKFIANPFSTGPGSRMYKTGDLGRWLPDGNIECLGRIDSQVKIRGYRIEIGEIESVLEKSELISQAVVEAKEDTSGNKRLIGYVVPEGPYDKEKIQTYLKAKLPEYMIPGLWVELESLPLTPNGKIDRKALPDPDVSEQLSTEYVAPRNDQEQKLAAIWQELLGIERVGIYDNFFELGGHSLMAMRMVAYIERDLQISIPISMLFQFASISDLSKYLGIQSSAKPDEKNMTSYKFLDV
jgi:amino acid adenylation domain-containing protein